MRWERLAQELPRGGRTEPWVWGWARKILPRCVLLRCRCVGMGNPKGGGGRGRWGRGRAEFCPGRMPSPESGSGEAHHTPPWARRSRPHSRPLHHTSSVPGCSGRSPCSGTHPLRRSSGLQGATVVRRRLLAGACWGESCPGAADAVEGRWVPGVPGHSLQLAGSSLPSTQSLSRSQTQTRGMQRLVMEHWNWLGAQVTSAAEWRRVRTCLFHPCHSTTARDHHLLPLPSSSCSSTSNFFRERDNLAPVLVLFVCTYLCQA